MKKVNYQKADAIRKRADRLDQIEFNLIRHDAQSLFLECGGPTLDLASEKKFASFEKAIIDKLALHIALANARKELDQNQYEQVSPEELAYLRKQSRSHKNDEKENETE